MVAVDTNVLVYAHRREASEHDAANGFVRKLAEGDEPWGIPWPCVYEFFSVVTNPRIWKVNASSSAPFTRKRACHSRRASCSDLSRLWGGETFHA